MNTSPACPSPLVLRPSSLAPRPSSPRSAYLPLRRPLVPSFLSFVCLRLSLFAPRFSSLLLPSIFASHSSLLTLIPHPSLFTSHTSFLILRPFFLILHASPLIPYPPILVPHSSPLIPHPPILVPHSKPLIPYLSLILHSFSLLPLILHRRADVTTTPLRYRDREYGDYYFNNYDGDGEMR